MWREPCHISEGLTNPHVLLDIRPLSSSQRPELEMFSPVECLQHVGDTPAAKGTVLLMVKCFPGIFKVNKLNRILFKYKGKKGQNN